MLKVQKYFLLLLLFFCCQLQAWAQTDAGPAKPDGRTVSPIDSFITSNHLPALPDSSLAIRDIVIEGNKKTRRVIILRELPFSEGDTIKIKDLPDAFRKAQTQLMNTTLFHTVNLSVDSVEGSSGIVKIKLEERLYLMPFPHFKPVDRNVSQWLFDKGASLARVDYGVKLMYKNVTGNRDNLRFYFVTGYTKQLVMGYHRPFIDKGMKWGMNFDLMVGKNKEINYSTLLDKQQFLKYNAYLKKFFNTKLEFTYRPKFFTTYTFGSTYNTLRVADSVLKLNPRFFNKPVNQISFPEIYYRITYMNLDYIPYPTRGYAGEIYLEKHGLGGKGGVDSWQLDVKGIGNWHLTKNIFYSISALGTIKVPFKQPFYNSKLLGYGDMFLRGYELYVVDGVAGGFLNATISRQLTNFSLHIPHTKWLTGRLIPLKIYGKIYGNTGYVHNPEPGNNRLPNQMLYGGGFGLDIFTTNDLTLKLEFSFNQLGQNGLYLQKKGIY